MKPRGFIPIVIAAVIIVIALAMVGAGVFYKVEKNRQPDPDSSHQATPVASTCSSACKNYEYAGSVCEREGSAVESLQKQQANQDKKLDTIAGRTIIVNDCKFSSVGNWDSCYCLKSAGDKLIEATINANSSTNGNTNTSVDTTGWKTYTNSEIGFSFIYPSEFGTVTVTDQSSDKGSGFIGKFSSNKNITFGGVTKDFSASRGAGFIDTYGYVSEGSGFFLLTPSSGGPKVKMPGATEFSAQGVKGMFVQGDNQTFGLPPVYGAVFNLLRTKFTGVAFDTAELDNTQKISKEQFVEIMTSFMALADTTGWKTYTNSEIGYSLKYPDGWTVNETNMVSPILNVPVRYIVVTNTATNNFLTVGIRRAGNTVRLSDRTGVGAGDFQNGVTQHIADKAVATYYLVYQGKIKEIWYHDPSASTHITNINGVTLESVPITVDDHEVLAEFSPAGSDNDSIQLDQSPDYATVNGILSSLTFTK